MVMEEAAGLRWLIGKRRGLKDWLSWIAMGIGAEAMEEWDRERSGDLTVWHRGDLDDLMGLRTW